MYDPEEFSLSGQVAVVTGAGAGIGRGIARVFAGAGAAVVVSDLKAETAKAVADEIVAAGGRATSLACNVTREEDLQAVVGAAINHFGKLTILVYNAGGGGPKPFDMPMDDFLWAYELNVFSVFRLSQLAAPHIEAAGGGAILNITSMAGENKNQRMASYASSKAAENHLTRNIAFDLGPKGIRVNAIAPGAIRTDALASVLNPDVEKAMLKHTPLGRLPAFSPRLSAPARARLDQEIRAPIPLSDAHFPYLAHHRSAFTRLSMAPAPSIPVDANK